MASYLTNCKYSLLIYQKCFQLVYLIPSLSLRTVSENQHPSCSICLKSGEFIRLCFAVTLSVDCYGGMCDATQFGLPAG